MKMLLTIITVLNFFQASAFSQEVPAVEVVFENASEQEQALADGFDADQIAAQVEQSRADLIANVGAEEAEKMVPVAVSYMMVDDLIKEMEKEQSLVSTLSLIHI